MAKKTDENWEFEIDLEKLKKAMNEVFNQISNKPRYLSTLKEILISKKLIPVTGPYYARSLFNWIITYNKMVRDGEANGPIIKLKEHRHDLPDYMGEMVPDSADWLVSLGR